MYASQSDIENRLDPKHLAELADDDGDGLTDADVVNDAVADADAVIDTYLQSRYTVPVASQAFKLLCEAL